MKRLLFLFIIFTFSISLFAQRDNEIKKAKTELARYGDLYFSFPITKQNNLKTIPNFISVDNVKKGIIYAYINERDFQKFINLNIPFTVIKKDKGVKVLTMATTVAEMSNWDRYPTHDVYKQMMQNFATNYPNICKLDTIGFSQNNRPILVVKISDNADVEENEPQFFYTGQMHGDEIVDYIMFLRLIDYLTTNYGTDTQVTNLINNIEIWINPLSNPDGTYHGGDNNVSNASRYLANWVDPNRNFSDPEDGQHPDGNAWATETILMMDFADNHRFVMSANTHSGAEVVNYPWDTWAKLHADDDWWQYVSREYADTVHINSPSTYFDGFNNGITNGYQWYTISGGRQDYMNYYKHCREFTLELSNAKLLSSDELPAHWDYNRQAMLNYMQECLYGITGTVTDAYTGEPVVAKVEIDNHDKDSSCVYSNSFFGSYYRPIYQGTYSLTFSAPNYHDCHVSNVTVANKDTSILNVQLVSSLINHNPEILDSLNQSIDTLDLTVYKDTPLSVKLNVNDIDGDNVDVTFGTSINGNGSVDISPSDDTSFVYTPNSGFTGSDLLQIVVSDDGTPILTDTVIYNVSIIAKPNHNPEILDSLNQSIDTLNLTVYKDTPLSVKLNVNDIDGDNVDVTFGTSINGNGSVDISPADDTSFVYTPNSGFTGSDLLQIVVSDDGTPVLTDTVIYNVSIVENHCPVILDSLGNAVDTLLFTVYQDSNITVKLNVNDEDGDNVDVTYGTSINGNGSVDISPSDDTSFVYTPNSGFTGSDLLQIVVSDDGLPVLTDTVIFKVNVVYYSSINSLSKVFNDVEIYPNPVSQTTVISFELSKAENVEIEIYNMLGKKVSIYKIGKLPTGKNDVSIDVNGLEDGIYLFRIKSDNCFIDKKVIKSN